MAKRRNAKRYTNPSGYRFTQKQEQALRKSVKDFNRRLQAAIKRNLPEFKSAFPQKLTFEQVASQVRAPQDVTRQMKRLSAYSRKGLEITEAEGRLITRAALEEYQQAIRAENRRRQQVKEQLQRTQEMRGRFRTGLLEELEPITLQQAFRRGEKTTQELFMPLYQTGYVSERLVQWQQNYLKYLDGIKEGARQQGILTAEAENLLNELYNLVQTLPPDKFEVAMYENPQFEIEIEYQVEFFVNNIAYILSMWRSYQ